MEEKNKLEEMRKQKEREEDLKYENKIRQQQLEEKQKYEMMLKQQQMEEQNNNANTTNPIPNTAPNFSPFTPKQEIAQYNYNNYQFSAKGKIDPNRESPDNMFSNPPAVISYSPNFYNNNINQVNTNPINNDYTNMNNVPNVNTDYNTINSNPPMDYNQMNPMYQQPQYQEPPLYRQSPMTPNIQNVPNVYGTVPQQNTFNRTQPINNYFPNQPQNINNYNNNDTINDEILAKFVSDQMGVIQEYEQKIDKHSDYTENSNDQIGVIKSLMNEKDLALEKLKIQQENFKNILGFYPMQSDFNNKINSLLDLILKNKIEKIEKVAQRTQLQREQYNTNYMSSSITRKVSTPIPSRKNLNSAMPTNYYNPPLESINNNINIPELENINIEGCFYRSKYEDLKRSIMNAEDINPDFKSSMAGFSKFVTTNQDAINNKSQFGNSTNFYQTWRESNDNANTQQSQLKSIKEEDNNTSEIKYNIPQSELLMSKSYHESKENKYNIDNNVTYNENPSKPMLSRHLESAKQMRIIKEEKDKSLLFVDNNTTNNNMTHSMVNTNNNQILFNSLDAEKQNVCIPEFAKDDDEENKNEIINDDIHYMDNNEDEEDIVNSKNRSIINQQKENEEEDNDEDYEADFTTDEKALTNLEKKIEDNNNKINLEDYKEIHESQKFQTQLNFFEDSCIDNVNMKNSRQHLVRPPSPKVKKQANTNKEQVDSLFDKYKSNNIIQSSDLSMNPIKDSYGDNIINDLDKYRKMALEESTFSNNTSQYKKY